MRPSPHGVLLALILATDPLAHAGEGGLPVTTAEVSQVPSYAVRQQFAGLVESAQQSTLAFTSSAPLAAMAVDAGDPITEGQTLARLDDRELAAALSSAQAAQRLAEAEHTAQRALAELAVMKAERAEALFERQQLAEQAFDDARLAAAAEQARERVAKARAQQAAAQAEEVAVRLSRAVLRAPYDGVVAERHVDEGALLAPGAPVLTVVSAGALEARIGMPPALLPSLKSDASYTLTVEGTAYPAALLQILPQLDPAARTATARFRFSTPTPAVRAGQLVELSLDRTIDEAGFWVPLTALAEANRGLWSLFLAVPDGAGGYTAQRSLVEILHSTTEQAFVRGDLVTGDRVVQSGVGRLVPGQALRIMQP